MFLKHPRRHPHIDTRQMTIRTKLTPTFGRPPVHGHPIEFPSRIVPDKTGEPIEDGDGCVPAVEAVADCGTGRGVHSSGGGTDMHDCDAELVFFGEGDIEGGGGDGGALVGGEVFLEFRVSKFHCTTEIFPADGFGDFVCLTHQYMVDYAEMGRRGRGGGPI